MHRTIVCITCPVGCRMDIEADDRGIISLAGNQCPRGKLYAENEFYNPKRILTTTIYVNQSGKLLPVRSDKPLPKDKLFDYMKEIKKIKVLPPVKAGQILKKDIEEGVHIIASCDLFDV